jgi:hypothetical protein
MRWWTLARASAIGFTAELVALALWPLEIGRDWLFWPFALAAGLAGLCGASMLVITGADMLFHPRRGDRVRPLRAFDIAVGAALVTLAWLQFG